MRGREIQVQRPERRIDEMRAHVADGAHAPIGPAAPVERVVDRVIVDLAGTAEEQVPGELVGRWIGAEGSRLAFHHAVHVPGQALCVAGQWSRARNALRPVGQRAVGPDVHFGDRADGAGLDVLVDQPRIVGGVALVSHLGLQLAGNRLAREPAALVHGPGQRFLHIDMFAQVHGRERDVRVHVIGRGHHHRVDVLLLLQHLAVVGVALGLRQLRLQLLPVLELIGRP